MREHLSSRLRSLVLEERGERCVVQFSRKGRPQIRREQRAAPLPPPSLVHDHQPAAPLPADRPDAFSHRHRRDDGEWTHSLSPTGQIPSDQRIPHAIGARAALGWMGSWRKGARCACSIARAAPLHSPSLRNIIWRRSVAIPAQLIGIDQNAALIEKACSLAERLGLAGAEFSAAEFNASAIRDYEPAAAPDILLALHACDTATDEALALGIRSGARLLLVAPLLPSSLAGAIARATDSGCALLSLYSATASWSNAWVICSRTRCGRWRSRSWAIAAL